MNSAFLVALVGLLAFAPFVTGSSSTHYMPEAGDQFHYAETTVLDNGFGDYADYTEHFFYNGTVGVTSVASSIASSSYSNTLHWENITGSSSLTSTGGDFSFSGATFRYVQGTDGQGDAYNGSFVWFYINNTLPAGSPLTLLDTPMSLVSTDTSYQLGGPLAGTYQTLYADGTGQYDNNGVYGNFTATYNWRAYFDPGTGYIVGYLYSENDTNATSGFTWTDTLWVTSTSYALTAASSPPATSGSGSSFPWVYVIIGIVVLILIVVIIAVALRRRSHHPPRQSLPQHSVGGQVSYGPPPPSAYGGPPPPINLTPAGEPAVQQIVIKETVKVKCAYCGALIDSTAKACPFCGAPRS